MAAANPKAGLALRAVLVDRAAVAWWEAVGNLRWAIGCVAQAEGEEIMRRAPAVGMVVGPQAYHRLPQMIAERRKNGAALQAAMADHPVLQIQQEIGQSSWFGFSLVIRPGSALTRKELVAKLNGAGFECRQAPGHRRLAHAERARRAHPLAEPGGGVGQRQHRVPEWECSPAAAPISLGAQGANTFFEPFLLAVEPAGNQMTPEADGALAAAERAGIRVSRVTRGSFQRLHESGGRGVERPLHDTVAHREKVQDSASFLAKDVPR